MIINLPAGTDRIEFFVSGGAEAPSVFVTAHLPRATVEEPPATVLRDSAYVRPTAGPRRLALVTSGGVMLLVGGFIIGATNTSHSAHAALQQPMALEMPMPRSMARAAPYEPPLERPDPEQQPQLVARQPDTADNVLRQLATRPTVTPPPGADADAPAPKNPFGLE